ncbi:MULTISPECIES: PIG-L family deacetylase [unclassified Streptomyces]|uniref:PIG-L family deacetylase n=1 Tax=unclassified Streptomyces TaxID=2593676 RepID=UPI002258C95F|nr:MULTISPECIES: PIG-L family deacetylase [unclassified Streptomyces]MCX4527147.1 PIG-L family deacetylase [Streptomyces sp. NBC_01551]MCX4542277.1 PIG-L family deacetylase [Streptomyces sp. NBC_01565]
MTPPRPTRRAVIAGLIVAASAAATAGCTSDAKPRTKATHEPSPKVTATGREAVTRAQDGTSGARVMQIVAHPDDDLYFINPEVRQSIQDNDLVVSVYVTSGESGGVNKIPGSKTPPKPDIPGYAGSRRQGLRQAYALMATKNAHAPWEVKVQTLPDGTQIEVDVLVDHPGVRLVFLGVGQHGPRVRGVSNALPRMWADPEASTSTLIATGSPVTATHEVTREGLIANLAALLDEYKPTLVRTLDPDPDMQAHDSKHRPHHDQPGYSDHPDHTATALFTYAALERYKGPGDGRSYAVMSYRGYYNERWPDNLPPQIVNNKAEALNAYGGSPDSCQFVAGCGDYDVARNRSKGTGWLQRTSQRQSTAAPRIQQAPDGRLTAFGVLGGQAAMWQESAPGSGKWGKPTMLGGDGLLPGLAAVLTKDGRWQLYSQRVAGLGPGARENLRELVMAEQQKSGGPFGAWSSLGNPEKDPEHGRRVGAPVVAIAGNGTVHLFARNWSKGVSTRSRVGDGAWSGWRDLGGADVQEGLTATTDTQGRVHLLAAGHDTVHHWTHDRPEQELAPVRTGLPAPADPPTVLARPDGSLLLVFRQQKTARPQAYGRRVDGGDWTDHKLDLAGRGYGPLALHPVREGVLLAARNNEGGTSLATLETSETPRWSSIKGATVGQVSLASDSADRPVLARLAPDATLTTVRIPQNGH